MSMIPTIVCDSCESHYMLDEEGAELPPHWIVSQILLSNKDGIIPSHERDIFIHFCSKECFVEYIKGETFKDRLLMVDRDFDKDMNNDAGGDDNVTN